MVPDTRDQVKVGLFTIQFLLPCNYRNKKNLKLDLWLWDSQAKIWWPGKAGVSRVQQDRKGFGLGTSPWVPFRNAFLCQAGNLSISERSVSLYLLPPGQQSLKTNLNKNQLWSLLKNAHFQPSFLCLYSWCWVPPRISTIIPTHVLLLQVVNGPQFKKHSSDRNLEDPIHRRSHTCESNISVRAKLLQLCPTLCDPMDWSPPSFSVHGILQAKTLEWVAVLSFRGSFQPRDRTQVSCSSLMTGGFFTAEPPGISGP